MHTTCNSRPQLITACLVSVLLVFGPLTPLAATVRTSSSSERQLDKKISSEKWNKFAEVDGANVPFPPLATVAPAITATQVDSFPDSNADGKADPGEVITYTTTISNTGSDAATDVQFTDTIDPNTTLVPGSVKISPLAFDDTYLAAEDTTLSASAPGVLANDTGVPAPTAAPIVNGPTTGGGIVTLNSDGSFLYNPAPAFTGVDTFTYVATNGQSPNSTATVTITVDAPPSVTATAPTNGATAQALNADLSITFSEPVAVSGNWFQVVCGISGTRNPVDTIVSGGPTTFTINPNADFATGESCTVTVSATQVTDQDANDPPDQMTADYSFSFSVTSETAPNVVATGPTNGATNIATNSNLTVTFSEPVNVTGNWLQIACGASGTRNAAETVITGGPTTFVVNPNVDFAQNETCTVTVFAAQVTDQDANDPPDNMAANFVFSFATDAAPSVTTTTPANGATNQPGSTNLTVTFSEPVDVTGNWFQIVCSTSGTRNVADTAVTGGPISFTINPNTDFTGGETCTVTITAAQVADQDANDPPNNMLANYVFSFGTDVGPSVTGTTPTNGATQQPNNTNITLTFSEPVNVSGNWFQIAGATSGTRNIADTAVSGGPTTFTINPNVDFVNGETVTVTVFAAQVTDQDANDPPDNMAANHVFSFTVDAAPGVSSTTPANAATSIAASTNISLTFSEAVNVTGNWFQIVCGSQTKNPGDTVVTGGPTTFTINPNSDLLAGNTCQVTVFAAQVTDQDSGDPPDNMDANFAFSFSVPPVAVNDSYASTIVGNVGINTDNSTDFSILANDIPTTVTSINTSGTSTQGGIVVVAPDGKFTYTPPAGYEGADSFTYTITNSAGTSNSATVSFTVAGMIWFINAAAGAGNGRLATPFNSVALFQAVNNGAGNNPAAGDSIFIYENALSYTGPLTLLGGQRLIGQDATATLATIAGVTVPADSFPLPGMNPSAPATTLNNSTAGSNVVNLNNAGTGNTIRGLTLTTGSTTSKGIGGTSFGTLTTADLNISGSGPALDLNTGSLSGSFESISSSGGANGIRLNGIGGSSNLGTGALSGSTAEEFLIIGGTVTLTYNGTVSTSSASARPVSISNKTTSGNVTFNGAVSSSTLGINLDNNDGATISFLGGLSLSTGTSTAFNAINGGTVVATQNNTSIVNTLTTTTGSALNVTNTIIGAGGLTFRSISSNGATNGILLNATGSNAGLTVTGNSSGLCGGQVTVNPVGTPATVTSPINADCTGGTIQNSTGAGISLTNTRDVSLTRMRITNSGSDGVVVNTITNFAVNHCNFSDSSGNSQDHAIEFGAFTTGTAVNGTINITNSAMTDSPHDNVTVVIASGTSNWNVTGNTISNFGNTGFYLEFRDTSTVSGMAITGNAFNGVWNAGGKVSIEGVHILPVAGTTGSLTANVSSNSFSDSTIAMDLDCDASAQCNYTASSNTIINATRRDSATSGTGRTASHGINVFQSTTSLDASLMNVRMENNVIGSSSLAGSGSSIGNGIRINYNGNGDGRVLLNNNTIRECPIGRGIEITGRNGTGQLDVTVTNNNVNHINLNFDTSNGSNFPLGAIVIMSNTNTITGYTVRSDVRNNTVPASGGGIPVGGEVTATYLSLQELPPGGGSTHQLVDHAPASASATAELQSHNTGDAGANAGVGLIAGPINQPTFAPITLDATTSDGLNSEPGAPATKVTSSSLETSFRSQSGARRLDLSKPKRDSGMPLRYSPADATAPLVKQVTAPAVQHSQDKKRSRTVRVRPVPSTPNAGETITPNVGTIPAGESVTITFQVTVNSPYLGGPNVSNQGTVSGSNFASVLTDDPAVGGMNDATLTPILLNPNVSVNDAKANEPATGLAPMLFTISLSSPAPASGTTVHYATADQPPGAGHAVAGVDYTAIPDTILSFAAGEQVKTVTVNILFDGTGPEPDETFLLNLSTPTNGVIVDGQGLGTIKQGNAAGALLISELRTSGPGGPGDDFVEFYNNSDTPLTIAASDSSAGYGLFKRGADCNALPILIGVIPNGTVIPARGHYLMVGSQYSLTNYGGVGAAAGDLTLSSDIESDRNVAVFTTSDALAVSSGNRLDAIGFGSNTGGICDLLREGATVPPVGGSTTEHSFHRDSCGKSGGSTFGACPSGGALVDANNNSTDLVFTDTQGTFIAGLSPRLGGPAPENLSAPIRRDSSIAANLLDQTVAATAAPNRVRDLTPNPGNNSTFGTMSIRRRFTNNTGGNVTRLRFRIIDISTLPSAGAGVADLRAITSSSVSVSGVNDGATCFASTGSALTPCTITVRGSTLEQPPAQLNGGGWNSTMTDGTITLATPLASGASANLQFLLGVQATGSFKFYIVIEALP